MSGAAMTAAKMGLCTCHDCGLLSRVSPAAGGHAHCPRCGTHLHARMPNSIARTWALLMAALICYVPANLLPMMKTTSLGGTQADTLMSGVLYFMCNDHPDWFADNTGEVTATVRAGTWRGVVLRRICALMR